MVFGKTIPASIPIAPQVDPAKAITATVSVPAGFGTVAASDGAIWVALGEDGSVLRIDPATDKIVATVRINDRAKIPADDLGIAELATENGQLWVTDRVNHAIARIDPATNQVVTRIPVVIVPFGLAITGDTLWTDNSYEDSGVVVSTIVRVDLKTQRAVATVTNVDTDIGTVYQALAASPDALWFDDWKTDTVKRLDPSTNKVVASVKAGIRPAALAVDDGTVWVLDHNADLVTRIDPATNTVVASIPLKGYPGGQNSGDCCARNLAVGAGAVWVIVGSGQRTLVRIDPQTNRATASLTFSPQFAIRGEVSVSNGGVWALGDQLYRIDPAAMEGPPGAN